VSLARRGRGCEQLRRIASASAVVEPHGRGAAAYQLEVEVPPVAEDVAEEATIAVDLVEAGVGDERDGRAFGEHRPELASGRAGEALAAPDLGRVDLDEPHVEAVPEDDRVAVDHAGDVRALERRAR
jgi:hypothetical protein